MLVPMSSIKVAAMQAVEGYDIYEDTESGISKESLKQLSSELKSLKRKEEQLELMTAIEVKRQKLGSMQNNLEVLKKKSDTPELCQHDIVSASDPSADRSTYPHGFGLTGSADVTAYIHTGKPKTRYKKVIDYIPASSQDAEDDVEEYELGNGLSLIRGSKKNKLLDVTLSQWMVANTKILLEMRKEMSHLPSDVCKIVEEQYLHYTIKIGELNAKYTWASVLRFDDNYRRRQAELDFPWGTEAQHLSNVTLKERQPNSPRVKKRRISGDLTKKIVSPCKPAQFCGYFNDGEKCPHGSECHFPHICESCGKNHRGIEHRKDVSSGAQFRDQMISMARSQE